MNNESDTQIDEQTGRKTVSRRGWLVGLTSVVVLSVPGFFTAQHFLTPDVDPDLKVPELATASAGTSEVVGVSEFTGIPEGSVTRLISKAIIEAAEHPLDPILNMAEVAIERMEEKVADYTAVLSSQVRADGKLGDERHLDVRIRHENNEGPDITQFSVYTRFLKPKSSAGQEAIWVKGWNNDKIVAHGAGLLNIKRVYLDPTSPMAMKGNRNPIWDVGIKNLLVQLMAKGRRDREHGECSVTITRQVEVAGRQCSLITVTHPKQREHFEFHIARLYIDDEHGFPIAYEGHLWPEKPGGELPLIEKFVYSDVKLNVGLKDIDFDPANEKYNYPAW